VRGARGMARHVGRTDGSDNVLPRVLSSIPFVRGRTRRDASGPIVGDRPVDWMMAGAPRDRRREWSSTLRYRSDDGRRSRRARSSPIRPGGGARDGAARRGVAERPCQRPAGVPLPAIISPAIRPGLGFGAQQPMRSGVAERAPRRPAGGHLSCRRAGRLAPPQRAPGGPARRHEVKLRLSRYWAPGPSGGQQAERDRSSCMGEPCPAVPGRPAFFFVE
jgi:hypothetical protein